MKPFFPQVTPKRLRQVHDGLGKTQKTSKNWGNVPSGTEFWFGPDQCLMGPCDGGRSLFAGAPNLAVRVVRVACWPNGQRTAAAAAAGAAG